MYYYKFKVYYDEVEDFVRDVEILANDNFESLHKLLYECIGLKGNEFAAFSICDPKWNKQKEITLMDTSDDEEMEEPEYDEGDTFSTKSRLPKFVMRDSQLNKFITDPHQHILYEYDFMNPKIFYLELQKTLQTDSAEGFPRCTFKAMELPPEMSKVNMANLEEPELEDEDYEDEDDDDLFGDAGFDDEDLEDLNEYSDF